ncbi:MAG: hypothetical protein M1837_007448 [Sclerophora amabilis]|nr:MAG: hypothetical protein M1837_007448 [Sclerophora amabilis]
MSFNAKNLSYELEQPSFLRKLRGEYDRGDHQRHEHPIARPKRLRDGEEDDEPTYVEEGSNETVSKADYEAFLAKSANSQPNAEGSEKEKSDAQSDEGPASARHITNEPASSHEGRSKLQDNVADIGSRNKRKVARIVAQDSHEDHEERENYSSPPAPKAGKKGKAKKKVKLSFDSNVDQE